MTRAATLVLALLLPCVIACGDDDFAADSQDVAVPPVTTDAGVDAAARPDAAPDECPLLTLGDTSIDTDSVARVGLQAPVTPALVGLAETRLTLELYEDDGTGSLPALGTGSFGFATAPDDNYGTCQHCVLLVGSDRLGAPKRAFYAKSGTVELTGLDEGDRTLIVGRVRDVTLREVGQNEDLTWFDLPGGSCFRLADWTFDTRKVNGGACEGVEQCPNELSQICDPNNGTCSDMQCSLTGDPPYCLDGEVCLSQLVGFDESPRGPAIGACYGTCNPQNPTTCAANEACRVLGPTQTLGICQRVGTGAAGSPCTVRDVTTGCVDGFVCEGIPGECARTCTFLTPSSGCDAGRACGLGNVCERPDAGDSTAIGATCNPSSPVLLECGIEGDAFRGLCFSFYDTPPTCQRVCRMSAPACTGADVCVPAFENPDVGVCRLPAVCGDEIVDAIGGEICDDGNQIVGDGCAADCRSVELGALCRNVPALPLDVSVPGSTVDGPSGFPSSCDPYVATRVAIRSFVPPSSGRLHVELTSAANLGLSLYGPCADDTTERRCRSVAELDVLDLDVSSTDQVLVLVRGADPETAGDFVLRASFIPAVCGDGQVVGQEVCDDGNLVDGDGCNADCSAVDYAVVCAALPTLILGTNPGSTAAGTKYFDTTGSCGYVNGAGRERSYRFAAPSAGTLSLTLTQPSADFVLAAYDGCSKPSEATFLACSNFAFPGTNEETTATLVKGQLVTVIVQGSTDTDAGEYVLSASFAP